MDLSLRNRHEKSARDQGVSISLDESEGWLVFQAHAVPTRLFLSAKTEGWYLVGTPHPGISSMLSNELQPAPYAHFPGNIDLTYINDEGTFLNALKYQSPRRAAKGKMRRKVITLDNIRDAKEHIRYDGSALRSVRWSLSIRH